MHWACIERALSVHWACFERALSVLRWVSILISSSYDIYIIGIACSSLGACARGCCPASSLMRAPPGRLDASFAAAFVIRPLGHSCRDYRPNLSAVVHQYGFWRPIAGTRLLLQFWSSFIHPHYLHFGRAAWQVCLSIQWRSLVTDLQVIKQTLCFVLSVRLRAQRMFFVGASQDVW